MRKNEKHINEIADIRTLVLVYFSVHVKVFYVLTAKKEIQVLFHTTQ